MRFFQFFFLQFRRVVVEQKEKEYFFFYAVCACVCGEDVYLYLELFDWVGIRSAPCGGQQQHGRERASARNWNLCWTRVRG